MIYRTEVPIRQTKALFGFLLLLLCLFPHVAAHAASNSPIPFGEVRIHYFRPDGNYSGWALYTWNASTENAVWCQSEVAITGTDSFGVYFDVTVNPAQGNPTGDLGFIINNCAAGQIKDPGPDQHLQITAYNEAWVIHADATVRSKLQMPSSALNRLTGSIARTWQFSRNTSRAERPMHSTPA